jgi:Tol biopolymer transport system component
MNVATKETVVLTESPVNTRDEKTGRWEEAGAIYPAWSSDSLKIAYRRIHMVTTYREDHQGDVNEDQIWVMNADGSNQKPVWESFGIYAWARDGRSLFVKDGKGITEVAIDSGIRRQITLWVHP